MRNIGVQFSYTLVLLSENCWPHNVSWAIFCSNFWKRLWKIDVTFKCLVEFAIETIWPWSSPFIEVAVPSRVHALSKRLKVPCLMCTHIPERPFRMLTFVLIWLYGKPMHRHCFNKSKGYRRKLACLGYFVERLVTSLKIYSAHYSVLISNCIVVDDNI